jgi:hypothetical protein
VDSVVIKPDIEKIRKWINEVINDPNSRRRILIRGTLELADRARAYPPEGIWNRAPGTKGNNVWYQRQFGTRYMRKNGTFGGKNTSQKLQKNWFTEIQKEDEFSASVYTEVTYAPYLYDPAQRVGWAASHGWQTVDEIADNYAPRFVEIVSDEIDAQIAKPID